MCAQYTLYFVRVLAQSIVYGSIYSTYFWSRYCVRQYISHMFSVNILCTAVHTAHVFNQHTVHGNIYMAYIYILHIFWSTCCSSNAILRIVSSGVWHVITGEEICKSQVSCLEYVYLVREITWAQRDGTLESKGSH